MEKQYQIDYRKGIANVGDLSRLQRVMARAQKGESLRLDHSGKSVLYA